MPNVIDFYTLATLFFVFLYGICIGSFLNVVIYRVPLEISVAKGFSFCPFCNNRIKAIDLIPLFSFLFLRGKCRHCSAKISSRYFFVELVTGLVFVSFFMKYGISAELFAFSFLMSVLIAVFVIDLDHMIIPDELVITGLIGGGVLFLYHIIYKFNYFGEMAWWGPLLGMFLCSTIILLIAILGSMLYGGAEVMGGGDIKLFAPIGLILGWKMVLVALFFSFISSGIISSFLLISKIKDRKDNIPFGPFIVLGTYITTLYGPEILKWYFMR